MVARVGRSGSASAERCRAFVRSARITRGILAKPLVELADAAVEGVDAGGPAREQHLGEAAGRTADVRRRPVPRRTPGRRRGRR